MSSSRSRELRLLVNEVWSKQYGRSTTGTGSSGEVKRRLSSSLSDVTDVFARVDFDKYREIAEEFPELADDDWKIGIVRYARELGLTLSPENVIYLIRDSLHDLPSPDASFERVKQILLAEMHSDAPSATLVYSRVKEQLVAEELFLFFKDLLSLNKIETKELILTLLSPRTADELLRQQFVGRKDVAMHSGHAVRVPDTPLVGRFNPRDKIGYALARDHSEFFKIRMQQIFLLAALDFDVERVKAELSSLTDDQFEVNINQATTLVMLEKARNKLLTKIKEEFVHIHLADVNKLSYFAKDLKERLEEVGKPPNFDEQLRESIWKSIMIPIRTKYHKTKYERICDELEKHKKEHFIHLMRQMWDMDEEMFRSLTTAIKGEIDTYIAGIRKEQEEQGVLAEEQRIIAGIRGKLRQYAFYSRKYILEMGGDFNDPVSNLIAQGSMFLATQFVKKVSYDESRVQVIEQKARDDLYTHLFGEYQQLINIGFKEAKIYTEFFEREILNIERAMGYRLELLKNPRTVTEQIFDMTEIYTSWVRNASALSEYGGSPPEILQATKRDDISGFGAYLIYSANATTVTGLTEALEIAQTILGSSRQPIGAAKFFDAIAFLICMEYVHNVKTTDS
ncbi:MAG: hypothetical protein ACFFCQ_12785 [Promethearchaeota archaeon]